MGRGKTESTVTKTAPTRRLPIKRVEDNLIHTGSGTWAAFVIPTRPWAFLTDKQRDAAAWECAGAYARLEGYEVHLRGTSRPHAVADWARALDDATPAPLGGKHPGSAFAQFLVSSQKRMHKSTTALKVIYLLVKLHGQSGLTLKNLLSVGVDQEALRREAAIVAEYVKAPGLDGREATPADIEYLLRRSVALGLPSPRTSSPVPGQPWETEDLPEITDGVHPQYAAFGQTVKITRLSVTEDETRSAFEHSAHEGAFRIYCDRLAVDVSDEMTAGEIMESAGLAGEAMGEAMLALFRTHRAALHAVKTQRERYVATLTLGRVEDVALGDSNSPWLTLVDALPFPVEISARVRILSGVDARSSVQKSLYVIRDMEDHHAEHREPVPLALARQSAQAQEIEDEMARGSGAVSARAHGWYRFAVSGATEDEALECARRVIDLYARARMTVVHPYGPGGGAQQWPLALEFVPGTKRASDAYIRRTPVAYLAAGMPQVSAALGDHRGPYLGYTVGAGHNAVMFDPHFATEVMERSGLVPIIGEQGAGKSVLLGSICYASALRGERTVILDPSGPLAALCDLPELRDHAMHVDLTDAAPGTLSPFGVVPEPRRMDYPSSSEYEAAIADAAASRKMLAIDILTMLLPPGLARDPKVRVLIKEAVRRTGGRACTSLWTVVEILESAGGKGADEGSGAVENIETRELWTTVGGFLREAGNEPLSRLFFPAQRDATTLSFDRTLTVLTMGSIVLPQGDEPEHWSTAEQMAVPLLHLASWFATKAIYGANRSARKVIALDEAHVLARWGIGRALFVRLARDSRKHNVCVLAASQNPSDILRMDKEIQNLYSTAFIGRIEDPGVARGALDMIRITGKYEGACARLSRPRAASPDGTHRRPRQFIMRDALGRVAIVEIDLGHIPRVLKQLNTTASPQERVLADVVA